MKVSCLKVWHTTAVGYSVAPDKLDVCNECEIIFDSFWGNYIACNSVFSLFIDVNRENIALLITSKAEVVRNLAIAWTLEQKVLNESNFY